MAICGKKHDENDSRQVFPRCEFPLIDEKKFVSYIRVRLINREPTSFVRLGDGEGMILARPTPDDKELWSRIHFHFGPQTTVEQVNSLADMMLDVIRSADVLGIREDIINVDFPQDNFDLPEDKFTQLYKESFPLREAENWLGYYHLIRLAHLHRFLSTHKFRKDTLYTSAFVHYKLSGSGALVKLILEQKKVGLISSKSELAKQMSEKLGIKVDFYQVPDIYNKTIENGPGQIHFPGTFERILKSIKVSRPGQLFLVGAGICGKIYCKRIKELGGIAIDIGAVCDSWINISSRPMVYSTLFDSESGGVPECLLLENQANQEDEE